MNRSGVLVLRPSKFELSRFYQLVKVCAKHVQNVLYVDFNFDGRSLPNVALPETSSRAEMYKVLEGIYKSTVQELNSLDIRVILENDLQNESGEVERSFSQRLDVALFDFSYKREASVVERACKRYNFLSKDAMHFLEAVQEPNSEILVDKPKGMKSYKTVAVGGTFDRIHNGHRLLLSTSCLLTNSRIVVGVSDETLLVTKTLCELIEPLEVRMRNVAEFIDDIKPGLIKEIVPLNDPAGPTKSDPGIECLVVSEETLNGGQAVNKLRKEAGLSEMDLFSIELVNEDAKSHDCKISSTASRMEDLGVLLQPPKQRSNSNQSGVYVIGLTGGIASGKSSIAKRLKKLGAETINADIIGHSVYEPGTIAYNEVVASFGDEILNSDGSINRRCLGGIVFSHNEKLHELNAIVWPRIMKSIEERILEVASKGCQICVVEAALLLEAGWDKVVDEVWVSLIPESEAITRMKERNGLSEEEARKRLSSQMKNKERVSRANVVLSTLWEPEYTQKQVEKAWRSLQERIKK